MFDIMFRNRKEAGRLLAERLKQWKDKNLVVLAIPRGGMVVGAEIAKALSCPLDIVVTKKIGAPGNPELAIGAVGPEGVRVVDERLARRTGADGEFIERGIKKLGSEVIEKEKRLRGGRKPLEIGGKVVILTDDGVATGATIEAAIKTVELKGPKEIVVAIPVAPPEVVKKLKPMVSQLVVLKTPALFWAVGQFYQEFSPVEDEKVKEILSQF